MDNPQQTLFDQADFSPNNPLQATDFPFYYGVAHLAELRLIAGDWVPALRAVDAQLRQLATALAERSAAGERILPRPENILRALQLPLHEVKVLILGQDPYPTPGHGNGLAFAAERHVRPLPRSLSNIYKELESDLGIPPAAHPDLSVWHQRGVLLLNQVLTVTAGQAGSHQKLGWQPIVEAILRALNERVEPVVSILWGAKAQALAPLLSRSIQIRSAHPSPLSASRGFFGSRPFSATNQALARLGREPIDWKIPA